MKAEYAKIVKDVLDLYQIHAFGIRSGYEATAHKAVISAIERCEALANKPIRKLTDGEMDDAYSDAIGLARCNDTSRIGNALIGWRAIIAAHIAKQSEPDEIPFDQKKLDEGGWAIKLVPPGESSHTFSGQTKVTLVRKT